MNRITTIFLDVDGTLTDGKINYNSEGIEVKAFHIKDGLIISAMVKLGYKFVVVTGRESSIVIRRMSELGVNEVFQKVSDKKEFIFKYLENAHISGKECCYIGDDLNDVAIMKHMGFRGCPADGCIEVKMISDFVSTYKGGEGAVRDVLEFMLKQNGDWEQITSQYE